MVADRLTAAQVQKLADDVRAKILAKAASIMESEGEIRVRIFPRRNKVFDIKVTTTSD